jgi:hypothetical protein
VVNPGSGAPKSVVLGVGCGIAGGNSGGLRWPAIANSAKANNRKIGTIATNAPSDVILFFMIYSLLRAVA